MHRGVVRRFRTNRHQDIDGLLLDDGTDVRFPPHVGHQIETCISIGDTITIDGETKTKPRGEVVFEARRIQWLDQTIEIHPPGPDQAKTTQHTDQAMNAHGKLVQFHWNRHGELDGFRLDDETEVKFPPHLAHSLEASINVGATVLVQGRRHVTPKGDVHLHADQIINQKTKSSVSRYELPVLAEGCDERAEPSLADIMRELKELRSLVEKLTKAKPKTKSA